MNFANIVAEFDEILSGGHNPYFDGHSAASTKSILNHLLYDEIKDKFSSSMYDSFQVFLDDKTEIKIDMYGVAGSFLDVIFGEKGWRKYSVEEREYDTMNEDDFTNILKLSLLEQFKNLKSMTITCCSEISLLALLSILDSTKIKSIDIIVNIVYIRTWVESTWRKHKTSLQHAYGNKGFSINFYEEHGTHRISIRQSI